MKSNGLNLNVEVNIAGNAVDFAGRRILPNFIIVFVHRGVIGRTGIYRKP